MASQSTHPAARWYHRNKERELQKRKKYYRANLDRWSVYQNRYYETNREHDLDRQQRLRWANPERTLLRNAKGRAKLKGLPFDLTLQDITIPERCPVFDIPIIIGGECKENSPSLDRVSPKLGYIKGNVRVISWKANRKKQDSTIDELEKIIAYMRASLP